MLADVGCNADQACARHALSLATTRLRARRATLLAELSYPLAELPCQHAKMKGHRGAELTFLFFIYATRLSELRISIHVELKVVNLLS